MVTTLRLMVNGVVENPGGGPTTSYLTGGVVAVVGDYRYHTFNYSDTLEFVDVDGAVSADYLVVAGGGGGGYYAAGTTGCGAGGAGGYRTSEDATALSISASQVVTVAAGGAPDTNGYDSSIGELVTSTGGGRGARYSGGSGAGSGGAGGGGARFNTTGGTGTSGQGFAGGDYTATNTGAGGGGAAEVGDTTGREGGDGRTWLDGVTRGGGGGGSGAQAGGAGGGGAGGTTSTPGVAGTANTGGGGGGGADALPGGIGGSGVVIVRYLNDASMPGVD